MRPGPQRFIARNSWTPVLASIRMGRGLEVGVTNVLGERKFIFEFYNGVHYDGLVAARSCRTIIIATNERP